MSTFTEIITETFHIVPCAACGVRFGINGGLYLRAVTRAEGSIYCPACGARSHWRESDDQKKITELERKLQWEVQNAGRQRAERERAEASLRATKAVVTRIGKRVSQGLCPCCHRTVRQLAAHMKTKHPGFVEAAK